MTNQYIQYLQTAKQFIMTHKRDFIVGAGIVAVLVFLVALYVFNNPPTVVYQPADARKLLTPAEAQKVLTQGDKVISLNTTAPVLSGDVATSQVAFSDSNPEPTKMMVAAVAVQSGVNDKGVVKVKSDFNKMKPSGASVVPGLGDSAYFDSTKGQLNVLRGRDWFIFSLGVGMSQGDNSLDDTTKLARLVL